MIYVSSSCVKTNNLTTAIETLHANGISHIELSGGTEFYPELLQHIQALQKSLGLKFIVHNYFPPPSEHFVLNLASLNDETYNKSLEHYKCAIEYSAGIGADSYGMHAGFFIDIGTDRLGKRVQKSELFDKDLATQRFCEGFNTLKKFAGDINLYVENNVFSSENHQIYPHANPFMLTCYEDYIELKKHIDFNLLLDIAHLKVSSNTLGLSFTEQLTHMSAVSDYWHLSDNNGLADENKSIEKPLLEQIISLGIRPKRITLEIYEPIDKIIENYTHVRKVLF